MIRSKVRNKDHRSIIQHNFLEEMEIFFETWKFFDTPISTHRILYCFFTRKNPFLYIDFINLIIIRRIQIINVRMFDITILMYFKRKY